ncbi:MAG: hypothetical protein GEU91_11440 [Rhizobiales bacterium]|nr:hypothetical protein [Hyphomicrobiales bacterium]
MGKLRAGLASAIPAKRSALLGAGIGFATGTGLLIGTIGFMGAGHLFAASTPAPAPWSAVEAGALKQSVTKLEAQIMGLKASVEASKRLASTQRAQITDRYERGARTQVEMQTRLAKIGDAVERLEKRLAAAVTADTTGTVAPRYAAAAAAGAATAGTEPPAAEAKTPPMPAVAAGWVIRDVFRGRALVANRRGVFEAAPGLRLPDLGRVEAVTRQNGRWVVVTERGIITAMRRPSSAYGD